VRFVRELELPNRSLTLQYRFAHHMYQNACFDALRATRKVALSRAIAERLVQRYGGQTDRLSDIALLFEVARDNIRAAEYWNLAAQAAGRLYAHDDSARLAQRGLALLANEPSGTDRAAAELGLLMTYALAIKTSKGYAVSEVGRSYERARELSRHVEDPSKLIPVLIGMSFSGTAAQLRDRVARLDAAGVTEIAYQPAGPDIPGELERMWAALA